MSFVLRLGDRIWATFSLAIKRLFSQVNFNYGRLGSKLGVTRQRAYQLVQQHLRATA